MRHLVAVLLAALVFVPAASDAARTAVGARLVVAAPWPAAFAIDAQGRIFYGERFTGEIHVFDPASASDTLFATLPNVATQGEQGLLGLALHPSYPSTPWVYAYYTRTVSGTTRNAIVRLTDSGGVGTNRTTLRTLPAGGIHNGGVIHFGPDRHLYAVVGDVGTKSNAQNLSSLAGKVLRMTDRGTVPADNPFGSLVWSYGLRNSFGFAFDPRTGNLFETENGPECNDELNRITKGGNYAWGANATCAGSPPQNTNQDGPAPRLMPIALYNPVNAPTGAAFCEGCGLGLSLRGRLLFGDWKNGAIHAVTLTSDRTAVASQTVVLDRAKGILALERGPNGVLYFSDPDGIYRLVRT